MQIVVTCQICFELEAKQVKDKLANDLNENFWIGDATLYHFIVHLVMF